MNHLHGVMEMRMNVGFFSCDHFWWCFVCGLSLYMFNALAYKYSKIVLCNSSYAMRKIVHEMNKLFYIDVNDSWFFPTPIFYGITCIGLLCFISITVWWSHAEWMFFMKRMRGSCNLAMTIFLKLWISFVAQELFNNLCSFHVHAFVFVACL